MEITGRKRHIIVDKTGLVVRAVVHSAEIRDADGVQLIFAKVKEVSEKIKKSGLTWRIVGKNCGSVFWRIRIRIWKS